MKRGNEGDRESEQGKPHDDTQISNSLGLSDALMAV